ncbi:MAG: glycosyltransferase [Candidatus Pacebacteria bacterium]|nr:glycosyltransferase [Candidatus Paceibacterota bacterium]
MRLLIVTQKVNQDDPVLGFFHRWIVEFAKRCETVTVVCLEEGSHELPANVKVLSLGKEKSSVVSGKLSVGNKIKRTMFFFKYILRERNNYDTVFVHMNPVYIVLAGLVWKTLSKDVSLWYTHGHVDWKLRIAEKLVNRIFTASHESFRLVSDKVIVTRHGIDTDHFAPLARKESSDTLRILTTGRVARVKNVDLMIGAVGELIEEGKDVSFTIVGGAVTDADSKYSDDLREMVKVLNFSENISFVGSVVPQEIVTYLQDADLFINMSNTGSVDKAVLEAFACGIPVISSNVAFKNILEPHGLFMGEQTAVACAETMKGIMGRDLSDVSTSLRDYVVSAHSLYNLIPLLISHMHHEASR